jgi:hypothetical protein
MIDTDGGDRGRFLGRSDFVDLRQHRCGASQPAADAPAIVLIGGAKGGSQVLLLPWVDHAVHEQQRERQQHQRLEAGQQRR